MSQRPRRNLRRVDYVQLNTRGIPSSSSSESEASSIEDMDEDENAAHLGLRLDSDDEDDNVEAATDSDESLPDIDDQVLNDNNDLLNDQLLNIVEPEIDAEILSDDDDGVIAAALRLLEDYPDENPIPDAPVEIDEIPEDQELPLGFQGPNYLITGRDNTTVWSYLCPQQTRARLHNQLPIGFRPGPILAAAQQLTKKEYFLLLFTEGMIQTVVQHTNRYAQLVYEAHNAIYGSEIEWSPTDSIELQAFSGLLLRAGIERNYDQLTTQFWSRDVEKRKIAFVATMSLKRFQCLTSFIRFDDVETRKPGIQAWLREKIRRRKITKETGAHQDPMPSLPQIRESKLDAIKNIFNPFVGNIQSYCEPDTHITIDEMLVRFRGRCPFRVYMPKKPGRYGIKIWAAVCSTSGYVLNLQIYEGKIGPEPERDLGKRVVLDLMELYDYTGRGVTVDNFFSSVQLAEELLCKQLTMVGTMRKSRRELPKIFVDPKGKVLHSSEFIFKGEITAVSYVAKKSKSVNLISSEHHDTRISQEPLHKSKPDIILHYNSTKGGVDTVDQMIQRYTCQRPTAKWPSKIFQVQLDISALNAFKIWISNNPDWQAGNKSRRREFIFQLSRELILPNIERRSRIPFLQTPIKEAIRLMGFEPVAPVVVDADVAPNAGIPVRSATPRRCFECKKSSRTGCSDCRNFICKQHQFTVIYCRNCRPVEVELPIPDE